MGQVYSLVFQWRYVLFAVLALLFIHERSGPKMAWRKWVRTAAKGYFVVVAVLWLAIEVAGSPSDKYGVPSSLDGEWPWMWFRVDWNKDMPLDSRHIFDVLLYVREGERVQVNTSALMPFLLMPCACAFPKEKTGASPGSDIQVVQTLPPMSWPSTRTGTGIWTL